MKRRKQQRYRGVRVEQRGYRLARVLDRDLDEEVGVYYRLGRWRFYRDDEPVRDPDLTACARRLLGAQQRSRRAAA
jgi:hypothetical protein